MANLATVERPPSTGFRNDRIRNDRGHNERIRSNWWALPVLMAGTVMIVLDFFVVNVALPSMQKDLHTSSASLEWVVAGYGLTFAVLLVTAGRLGDRCGRRLTLCVGLALFGAASFLCGVAPNSSVLIGARMAQGAAAALISPSVLALLGVLYSGEERVRAISIYGVVMGLAAAGGQLIGGVILQADLFGLGWRSLFLINIPIAVVALIAAPRLVPESRAERRPAFDVVGVVLVTTGLLALVLPLVQGRQLGWPAWTWVCLASAPAVFAVFVAHQRRLEKAGGSPVLPPSLFANSSLRAGLVTQLAFWCGQAALFLVLALYLQEGRHLNPLRAGLVFSILAASYLATSMRAQALTVRHGREVIALGAVLLAAGDGMLAATSAFGGAFAALVVGLLVAGAGMGLCVTPLTSVVLVHTDPESAGAVSGALSTMQQVGNSLGVAVTGAIFFGAATAGVAHAFELSALELAGLLIGVALLTRLLPRVARAK
jgi:EmrB/QacA subfamily drug resistance transporter